MAQFSLSVYFVVWDSPERGGHFGDDVLRAQCAIAVRGLMFGLATNTKTIIIIIIICQPASM